MASRSPFEAAFLENLSGTKRKRSDLLEALETVKNTSLSELSQLRNVIRKDDLLWLLQLKIPAALKLADIVRSMPQGMPQAARKIMQAFYFSKLCKEEEIDVESCASLLLFCTDQRHPDVEHEVEILAPPVNTCTNCSKMLKAQNKMSNVTVFSMNTIKTAMKLCLQCQDCDINYGYSMFGNGKKGYRFYDEERPYVEATDEVFLERSLCLLQISLA